MEYTPADCVRPVADKMTDGAGLQQTLLDWIPDTVTAGLHGRTGRKQKDMIPACEAPGRRQTAAWRQKDRLYLDCSSEPKRP